MIKKNTSVEFLKCNLGMLTSKNNNAIVLKWCFRKNSETTTKYSVRTPLL